MAAIYGGDSMDRQIDLLESGVQLIAGTPGRVLDHPMLVAALDVFHILRPKITGRPLSTDCALSPASTRHIPGAVNLPKDQWPSLKGLRKDKMNLLYCYSQVCHLAATAAVEFAGKGYPIMELDGGWRWWKDDGFEIEK